ncbi:hypothetical protein V7111_16360 [Neobacillus niacini]|uniref:hypothetical protein n=1 Tax=Neobacillus niacini TaxID=86668 RepID=UPI003002AE78
MNANSSWHFVYIDACESAVRNLWSTALGIKGTGSGTSFVGWNNSITADTSYQFNVFFWSKIGKESVYQAVLDAIAATLAAGRADCNPSFSGDPNYYGWAW